VNHSAKEYVRDEAYTNTIEGCLSILKRGIYGVYQHVSEAHLKRYLAEFSFRYSYRIKTATTTWPGLRRRCGYCWQETDLPNSWWNKGSVNCRAALDEITLGGMGRMWPTHINANTV